MIKVKWDISRHKRISKMHWTRSTILRGQSKKKTQVHSASKRYLGPRQLANATDQAPSKKVYIGRYKVPIGRQAPMGLNESLEKLFKRTFHSHSGTQAIYFDDTLLAKANAWRAIHGFSW